MDKTEKCQQMFSSEYKISFFKTVKMHVYIYASYIQCEGIKNFDGTTYTYDIDFEDLRSVDISTANGQKCLTIEFKSPSLFDSDNKSVLYILGLSDFEKCQRLILHYKDLHFHFIEQQKQIKIEREEKTKHKEMEAKEFFDECYRFHVSENTPTFQIFSEKNKVVLIYIDNHKALNFLKIDGYEKNEDVGMIPYDSIHYYEKAGSVHYVSETNGSYSSFGGSLTGATFSKKAALFHGIMFGPIGMAAATLMSYKPSQQKQSETHFDLSSETKRIDERNVILNFYSDERKQYVDIELPQDTYNFLQTYLPDKRYSIVTELEKHTAVQNIAQGTARLDAPADTPKLPKEKTKLSIDEFKEKVEKLKIMYEAGMLTDVEFANAKTELLSSI